MGAVKVRELRPPQLNKKSAENFAISVDHQLFAPATPCNVRPVYRTSCTSPAFCSCNAGIPYVLYITGFLLLQRRYTVRPVHKKKQSHKALLLWLTIFCCRGLHLNIGWWAA